MTAPEDTIRRIRHMEAIFDRLQQQPDPELLEELLRYYEGGQWLLDYRADERGELPRDLKRGVLSEDGVWNLLTELAE